MKAWLRFLLMLLLVGAGVEARAAISCTTLTSPGVVIGYVSGTTAGVQTSFTITCTRSSTSDPTSISYSVQANNGLNSKGVNNFARLSLGGTDYTLSYDVWTPSCGATQWKGNVRITGTVTWAPNQTEGASDTQTFWGCIQNVQNPTAAGAYEDQITMTATYNPGTGNATVTGTIPVTIYAPASCVINPAPGNVNIVYPAFSAVPQASTTSFGATCTAPMPYSLAVTPTNGTLAGVNYNVTLSTTAATGTGTLQTHTITVTAPAGQGGTCTGATCTATQTHTLTVTY